MTLKEARINAGLTQQALADKANLAIQQIQRWEYGERDIAHASAIAYMAVVDALKVDPHEFLPK